MAQLRPKTVTKTRRDACSILGKRALRYRGVSCNLPPTFAFEGIERGQRGAALRGLFAFAAAAAQLFAIVKYGAFKNAVVIRPCDRSGLVAGRVGRAGLEFFLQLALRVVDVGNAGEVAKRIAKAAENKIPRCLEAAIEKNRAEDRFERVGQGGLLLASAAGFFAATEDQVAANLETSRLIREATAVDHLRTRFGERPFADGREFIVELLREDQAEHGVAEKFEALIVRGGRGGFVRDGWVRESQPQQFGLRETVAEPPLDFFQI